MLKLPGYRKSLAQSFYKRKNNRNITPRLI